MNLAIQNSSGPEVQSNTMLRAFSAPKLPRQNLADAWQKVIEWEITHEYKKDTTEWFAKKCPRELQGRDNNWALTINNMTEWEFQKLLSIVKKSTFVLGQFELGDARQRLHVHIWLHYKEKYKAPWEELPRAHISRVQNLGEEAEDRECEAGWINYIQKNRTRVVGPFAYGRQPMSGLADALRDAGEAIASGKSVQEVARAMPVTYMRWEKSIKGLSNEILGGERTPVELRLSTISRSKLYASLQEEFGWGKVYAKPDSAWWDGYSTVDHKCIMIKYHARYPWDELISTCPAWVPRYGGVLPFNPQCLVVYGTPEEERASLALMQSSRMTQEDDTTLTQEYFSPDPQNGFYQLCEFGDAGQEED